MPRKMGKIEKDLLQSLGLSPAEAMKLSFEELMDKAADVIEQGDAEMDAAFDKEEALAQQREGEAQYIARLQPQECCFWAVSYSDLGYIDPESKQQKYIVSVFEDGPGFMLGRKITKGRPSVDEAITVLQVSMAFPMEGKGRRPLSVLVAWRMRDMWPKLQRFLNEMEIVGRLETREEAAVACEAHGTDVEGRNNPVPDDAETYKPPPAEVLKNDGNRLFSNRRYAKAAEKYTEALQLDPKSAVLFSNRAIAHLHMGLHAKALADAEEAIKLDPTYQKAHARKGTALEKLGRVDEARAHYQECIKSLKNGSHFKEALKKLDAAAT